MQGYACNGTETITLERLRTWRLLGTQLLHTHARYTHTHYIKYASPFRRMHNILDTNSKPKTSSGILVKTNTGSVGGPAPSWRRAINHDRHATSRCPDNTIGITHILHRIRPGSAGGKAPSRRLAISHASRSCTRVPGNTNDTNNTNRRVTNSTPNTPWKC
jgi:hypothetical protein